MTIKKMLTVTKYSKWMYHSWVLLNNWGKGRDHNGKQEWDLFEVRVMNIIVKDGTKYTQSRKMLLVFSLTEHVAGDANKKILLLRTFLLRNEMKIACLTFYFASSDVTNTQQQLWQSEREKSSLNFSSKPICREIELSEIQRINWTKQLPTRFACGLP